jgi:hypothetical protein
MMGLEIVHLKKKKKKNKKKKERKKERKKENEIDFQRNCKITFRFYDPSH